MKILRMIVAAAVVVSLSSAVFAGAEETGMPLLQPQGNSPLTLEIFSDKVVYASGEDITIKMTFKNNSGGRQTLKFDKGDRLHAFFSFEISRDGKPIEAYRYIDTKDMQFPIEEKSLAPGETYAMSLVINRLDWHKSVCPTGSPFDKKGRYDIRVIYFGASAKPEDNVVSNTLTIEVKGKNIFGWRRGGFESLAEASEQQVPYTDVVEAYAQKRYTDARESARRHLKDTGALMEAAKNDFDLEAALRRALGVMHTALDAESVLGQEAASARSPEFLVFLREDLDRVKTAFHRLRDTSATVRAYLEQEISVCDSLQSTKEIKGTLQPLALTIQTAKEVYGKGEPINIEANIKNLGDDTARIYSPGYWGVSEITVTNSQGMAMRPRGIKIERASFEPLLTIPSQSSVAYTFENLTWFHCGGAWQFAGDAGLPPDTYTIHVTVTNPRCVGARILSADLSDVLTSNTIIIKIKENGSVL